MMNPQPIVPPLLPDEFGDGDGDGDGDGEGEGEGDGDNDFGECRGSVSDGRISGVLETKGSLFVGEMTKIATFNPLLQ
jgi:hypothetical protein